MNGSKVSHNRLTLYFIKEEIVMMIDIHEKGKFLRKKKNHELIIVNYVEISTKNGKLVYKIYDNHGDMYDIKDLY